MPQSPNPDMKSRRDSSASNARPATCRSETTAAVPLCSSSAGMEPILARAVATSSGMHPTRTQGSAMTRRHDRQMGPPPPSPCCLAGVVTVSGCWVLVEVVGAGSEARLPPNGWRRRSSKFKHACSASRAAPNELSGAIASRTYPILLPNAAETEVAPADRLGAVRCRAAPDNTHAS